MKFTRIVAVDYCGLTGPSSEKIARLSTTPPAFYENDPESEDELIRRVGDADCVLVSWRTRISQNVFKACPAIKYVGMCCSLYDEKAANVDIATARAKGIVVAGAKHYGDNGTVEFIFSELISLFKGLGARQWRPEPTELTGKTLGVVGMGVVGAMVTRAALLFGMKARYFSRTRKPETEKQGAEFSELDSLLADSDVITAHLPRNVRLFTAREFGLMKKTAVFVNTSLGQPYDEQALFAWLNAKTGNYAIFDLPGSGSVTEACDRVPNMVLYRRPSGFTAEARVRLTDKVLANMLDFLRHK